MDVHKLVNMICRQANESLSSILDNSGYLIDERTGSALVVPDELPEEGVGEDDGAEEEEEGGLLMNGYSFFDSVSTAGVFSQPQGVNGGILISFLFFFDRERLRRLESAVGKRGVSVLAESFLWWSTESKCILLCYHIGLIHIRPRL